MAQRNRSDAYRRVSAAIQSTKNLASRNKYRYALDTNVIYDLTNFSIPELRKRFEEQCSYGRTAAIRLLAEAIEEFSQGKTQDIITFEYADQVVHEMMYKSEDINKNSDKYSESEKTMIKYALNAHLRFGFVVNQLNKHQTDGCKFLYFLMLGLKEYYPQFTTPLFGEKEHGDTRVIAANATLGMRTISSNFKDFIGENRVVQKGIAERFEACNDYFKYKYDVEVKGLEPLTVLDFLQLHFPEKYQKFNDEMKELLPDGADPFKTYPPTSTKYRPQVPQFVEVEKI